MLKCEAHELMTGFALRKINSALSDGMGRTSSSARAVLLAGFVLGLLFGFFVGISSGEESLVPGGGVTGGAFRSAWLFFLLLFIFSTSYLGLVLIPSLMFVRGAVFSCSVSVDDDTQVRCASVGTPYKRLIFSAMSSVYLLVPPPAP